MISINLKNLWRNYNHFLRLTRKRSKRLDLRILRRLIKRCFSSFSFRILKLSNQFISPFFKTTKNKKIRSKINLGDRLNLISCRGPKTVKKMHKIKTSFWSEILYLSKTICPKDPRPSDRTVKAFWIKITHLSRKTRSRLPVYSSHQICRLRTRQALQIAKIKTLRALFLFMHIPLFLINIKTNLFTQAKINLLIMMSTLI